MYILQQQLLKAMIAPKLELQKIHFMNTGEVIPVYYGGQKYIDPWVKQQMRDTPQIVQPANIDNLIQNNSLDIAEGTPKTKEEKVMPYLKKEHGSFYKRGSGRWVGKYKGKQTAIGRDMEVTLKRHYDIVTSMKKQLASGGTITTKIPMLYDVLDKWYKNDVLQRVQEGRKRIKGKIGKDRAKKIGYVVKLIKANFPNKPVDDMKVHELETASKTIQQSRTREDVDNILCMALTWAHKKEHIKRNIVEHYTRHRHEREQGRPFTKSDEVRILEYMKINSKYYFHFMFYDWTGSRASEIKEVRHCDFDLFNKTVFIDGTKTKLSSRKVPLFAPLYELAKSKIVPGSKEKVFTCKVNTLRAELKRVLLVLGIAKEHEISDNDDDATKYTLKSFRHTFATRRKEEGIDPKLISKWMGHTNTAMTDHYTHIQSEYEQQQAAVIDKIHATS